MGRSDALFICHQFCKRLQNLCKGPAMSTFSKALKELAEPRPVGDTVQSAIVRASRAAGIPYPRAFNIWYRRARRIDAHEAEAIQRRAAIKTRRGSRRQ
jgi:hypothetical protein